jgi:magnesium-transporting ATPase (P-type)
VAIVVVAVPEGLPLAVMISLAYSVQKMLIDNNFVKKLSSCETMGGANNICSDKTGTLTKNQMTWTTIWAGKSFNINNPDGALTDMLKTSDFCNDETLKLLGEAVCVNTMDSIENSGATEKAMLKFIVRCGFDIEGERKKIPSPSFVRFQFDSSRKRMSTIIEPGNGVKRIHVKGASEIVLESCTHYLDSNG